MATKNPTLDRMNSEEKIGQDTTYKLQLDQAAKDAKRTPGEKEDTGKESNLLVEKVSQYVPAVGRLLGNDTEVKQPAPLAEQIPGPPERPLHDAQIEEFVRDQHRSKVADVDETLQ